MSIFIKRAFLLCFFVAAAMIVAAPATAGSQTKTAKETKEVKKDATKTASCCADKKGADAKACADGKDCCADGKHAKADASKAEASQKDASKKDDGKKDDGR